MAIIKTSLDSQDFINDFLRMAGKTSVDEFVNDGILVNDSHLNTETESYDILVICALPEEREQLFEAFSVPKDVRKRTIQSFRADYNFIYQKFSYSQYNVAVVTQNAMGMAAATSLTTRAILAMQPKIVVMVGICAGRKGKVGLGDIIIADQVFDYTAGKKYVDRFAPRPLSFCADDDIRNYVAVSVLNNDQLSDSISQAWRGRRISHRISIHMKAIASGTAVIDDEQTMMSAAAIQDNLYGIDMEAYGVALACSALRTQWLVIKSVQDFADGKKEQDEGQVREFAAFASAEMFKKIILNLLR